MGKGGRNSFNPERRRTYLRYVGAVEGETQVRTRGSNTATAVAESGKNKIWIVNGAWMHVPARMGKVLWLA
jgi:hypothetical protein